LKFYPQIDFIDISRKEEIDLFLQEWYGEESSLTVHTSGSTGEPKSIQLSKVNMLVSANKTIDFLKIKKGTNCYQCLSCNTIAGKMMMVRAIMNEMRIIVGPVSSSTLELLDEKVSLAAIVPLQLQQIMYHLPEKLKLIENVLVGGAPINDSIQEMLRKEKLTVFQTFGMTETISHVALRRVGYQKDELYFGLDGLTFSTDEQQRLIIHYPEIGLPEILTNDLVELHSSYSFKWLGRADFAINSGGVKILPELIESKLSRSIDRPFFIFALPDEKLGQKVVLAIEGNNSGMDMSELSEVLNKYEKPKNVFFLPQFIRSESGKINRTETIKLLSV
jgi:O-succinylbenzoic acid--CoA ligase